MLGGLRKILCHWEFTICCRFNIRFWCRHICSGGSSYCDVMNTINFIRIVNTLSLWSDSYHWSTKSLVISRLWAARRLRIMNKIGLILRCTSFVKWVDWRLLGLISSCVYNWANWLRIFNLQSYLILIPSNINIHVSTRKQ